MTSIDLTQKWLEVFNDAVKETEEKSGIPSTEWKTAGRKTTLRPDGEDLSFWQSDGLKQVEAYQKWYDSSGWKIATMPDGRPGIEWAADVHFGGTPVRFIVDAIYQVGEDLVIVDYKTGSRTPFGAIQAGLYASGIERSYGIRPKWGAFFMTRKGELDELIDLSHLSMEYFDYVFGAMNASVWEGWFPPSVGDSCRMCSFTAQCPAMGGKDFPLQIQGKRKGDELDD
jgi:hypothetical protein